MNVKKNEHKVNGKFEEVHVSSGKTFYMRTLYVGKILRLFVQKFWQNLRNVTNYVPYQEGQQEDQRHAGGDDVRKDIQKIKVPN